MIDLKSSFTDAFEAAGSVMYGVLADKLVQDARRTANLETLPLYPTDLVRAVVRETQDQYQRALAYHDSTDGLSSQDRVAMCALFVAQLCVRRNKRCLLAHENLRASRLDQAVWAEQELSAETMSNLSAPEQVYLREYTELVSDYKGEWTEVDLTGSLDPPKEIYVEVRVLQDAGEVQTEYGVFNLTKDSQFFVRQADVQRLIQQGFVQLI